MLSGEHYTHIMRHSRINAYIEYTRDPYLKNSNQRYAYVIKKMQYTEKLITQSIYNNKIYIHYNSL